ncbi:MAG: serine/threonine-protein phosphatase [Oscillospiraceae bacterium]|nr:serine/threonine-protein phosphatase [Oscillospiraceae bacterium]
MKMTAWFKGTLERMRPQDIDDIFILNEQQGNRTVALTIVVTEAIYIITLLLNILGIFKGRALTVAMTEGIIIQLIPLAIYTVFGPGKPWMKHVLLGGLTFSLSIIDGQLTYKTALLMVIPIVVSIRYFSRITTLRVAVFTVILFTLSAIYGAVHGILDVNIVDLPQNFTLFIEKRLVTALKSLNLPESMLIRNTILLSFFPKLLLYMIIAYASVKSAARGHQMILEQKRISRVDAELSMAHDIQQSILPDPACAYADRSEFDIFATMEPAREIGGDYYDFFMVDGDHLCLVIADVSDKGIPAALFMMSSRSMIKSEAMLGSSPKDLLESVNRRLCENNPTKMFVTVWIGILEISTGKLTCVNAGHENPFIRSRGGAFRVLRDKHGVMVGVTEKAKYINYTLELSPGDTIFVYTDGVPEANDAAGKMYGMERLEIALNQAPKESPEEILFSVRSDVNAFVNGAKQFDDMTMLCLVYRGIGYTTGKSFTST